jgi:hypothetical protein
MSNSSKIIAPKRRRLTDLYLLGKEIVVNDDSGNDPISLWLSKLSPVEQRDAAEQATKARARILAIKNSPEASADRLIYEDQLFELGLDDRSAWIEFLAASKLQEAELSNEERIGSEGEWAENDYLKSLQEAWNSGLSDKWIADPEDDEAKTVYTELRRFADIVVEATSAEREAIIAEFEGIPDEDLKRKAINRIIESESDFAWMNEFAHWQVYYAVREVEDHSKRYFESREEVDYLDNRILTELVRHYREMTVDSIEGKD